MAALQELGNIYDSTEKQEGFAEIPDGKYDVRIDKAQINHSKGSGRLQVSWELTVVVGQYAGRKLWKHDGIENQDNIGWFKGGLAKLGVEAGSATELPGQLDELVGTFAQVTAKTREGNTMQNVYFNQAIDDPTGGDAGAGVIGGDAPGDDDVAPLDDDDVAPLEDDDAGDAPKVTTKFDDAQANKIKANITQLAAKPGMEFDVSNYTSMTDLLADMAEYVGVEGEFDSASKLFNATASAWKAKKK